MTRGRKMLWLNVALLVGSAIVWATAIVFGWLDSVAFVSHVSMAALVLTSVAGIPGAAPDAE